MNSFEKTVKACAIGLAFFIILTIMSGIAFGFSFLAHFFEESESSKSLEKYEGNFLNVTHLKLDLISANVTIVSGDKFQIESSSLEDKITIKNQNGFLKIEEKNHWGWNNDLETIHITIPNKEQIREINIDSGAGKVNIQNILIEKLELEQGAGIISIENSQFQTTKISGGAGKIEIKNSHVNDLKLQAGAGEVNIRSKITGESKIECGVGKVSIDVLNNQEDYTLKIERGIGSVHINNEKIEQDKIIGNGSHLLKIEGGIGSFELNFTN